MALKLTAEPLTTHVLAASLQWGSAKPQSWLGPLAQVLLRNLPTLRAFIWPATVDRRILGHSPGFESAQVPPRRPRRCGVPDKGCTGCKPESIDRGTRSYWQPIAVLCDRTVALVTDVVQCMAPHAMILPREGWEGRQHTQTPAAPLVAQCVELGGAEFVYLDRSVERVGPHLVAHHQLAPDTPLMADPLCPPPLMGHPPEWPSTWDTATTTQRMAPGGRRST